MVLSDENQRVTLKGEYPGYINASFVNVSAIPLTNLFFNLILFFYSLGLPREEDIYHSSVSNGEHCQRLLEDGGWLQSTSSGHVVWPEWRQCETDYVWCITLKVLTII